MARQTLGRGLNALLGDESAPKTDAASFEIDIDLIEPNPEQPRTRFAEANLEELAQSIRVNGVVQPILLRSVGGRYQIVAGERRWRASQRAGLRKIPAVVREVSDEKLLELALVENIQRQELNPIEEAKAYRKLIDTIGLTQEEVAERVGKERSVVTTSMRLLRLPGEIQRVIEEGGLSAGHGRALLMVDDPSIQREVANQAIDGSWSVRETERAVKKARSAKPQRTENKGVSHNIDANVKAAETKLMRALNTNVKIVPGKKGSGGKIEIEYYGTDDLDRVFQLIMKK
ncbi:MAG TPA: ParB/RepB/Spo0J family partition protein [Pyrinomonadaceae bacterium]|nr:ParB/RepB/Spo0J family partition protein [Pyrinomonadaceae bacterium]